MSKTNHFSEPPLTRAAASKGVFWAAFGALGRYGIAGITMLILTRLLKPEDFGLIAITVVAQLMIENVAPVGFHDALIQRARLEPADLRAAFWSVLISAGGFTLVILILAQPIADWFGRPILAPLLIGMALAALIRASSAVPRALLHRRLDFRNLALARLAGMLAGGLCAVGLAASGAGVWSLAAQSGIVSLIGTVWVWKAGKWRSFSEGSPLTLENRSSRQAWGWLWRFAPSVSLFTALSYVITKADDQLIGYQLGAAPLGFYALAYSLMAWPVRDVLGGVAVVFFPVLSRLQGDLPRLRAVYLETLQLAVLFAFPTLALLVITAPVLIPWLLGARWTPVVLATQILALGGLREATIMLNGPVYRALGKPYLHLLFEVVSVPCYLTAFIVGLDFGIEGVALFYILTGILLQPVSWWLVLGLMEMSLQEWLRAVLPAAAGTVAMAAAAILALHYTQEMQALVRLGLASLAAGIVYGVALAVIRPPALRRVIGLSWVAVQKFTSH